MDINKLFTFPHISKVIKVLLFVSVLIVAFRLSFVFGL